MRRILLIGITVALVACGSDGVVDPSRPPTPSNISGSYSLAMVDGGTLPFAAFDEGAYHVQIVAGTLALNANGTFALAIDRRVDDAGHVRAEADSDAGAWSIADHALTFTSTQGKIGRTATVSGNAITMQSSVHVFVLRK